MVTGFLSTNPHLIAWTKILDKIAIILLTVLADRPSESFFLISLSGKRTLEPGEGDFAVLLTPFHSAYTQAAEHSDLLWQEFKR